MYFFISNGSANNESDTQKWVWLPSLWLRHRLSANSISSSRLSLADCLKKHFAYKLFKLNHINQWVFHFLKRKTIC